MNITAVLVKTTRLPFLILTPACVAVGVGTAFRQTGVLAWKDIGLVLIGALCAHVSVNVFNEYFDFVSGLDARTKRTPFSGGSGALPAHPQMKRGALILAWAAFAVTAAVGIYFVWLRGPLLLPVGLTGLLLLITYTIWWTHHPVLSLIAPGLGFGILMVMGTHFALTGTYSWTAFIASLVPCFLVSDLLLLNQFPDVDADRSIGRRHYPIVFGRQTSSILYGVLLASAFVSIVVGVILKLLPAACLVAVLTIVPGWRAFRLARAHADAIPALMPAMGLNVVVNIVTCVLLAAGLLIG